MEIKVPAVGESIFEALIARWLKKSGDYVVRDEPLCEIETDKVTLEVNAEGEGVLSILSGEGETVKIGAVIGTIDEQGTKGAPAAGAAKPPEPAAPAAGKPAPAAEAPREPERPPESARGARGEGAVPPISPSGRKLARELGVEARDLKGTGRGGRVMREDLLREEGLPAGAAPPEREGGRGEAPPPAPGPSRAPTPPRPAAGPPPAAHREGERITRKAMTPIRKRIAQRLVEAKQQSAMLTTFNEADMGEVLRLRKKYGEFFLKRHNVKLGLMSFFVRACCQALQEFPEVNASIEGDDIVYHNYCDIGIAIGGEKGLVVPVLRDAQLLTLAEIERQIAELSEKVRSNRLAIADLEGGTFTVSNGGVYGNLLSTPILNPPQSGVLGMHAIQERAVVREKEIVIRPMMYLALSYDHRIVDGRGSVGFLKKIKEYIEEPEELLLEG